MKKDVIRWGIIGCGDVTEVKSGPAFGRVEGSQLVAVMRRDGAKAADYAKRHGVPRWYDDGEALIADGGVDAVYIATPPGAHEEWALKVAGVSGGGKPCYVEKPMARTALEGERMVQAFKHAGLPLYVAYYRRALPRFLKVKEVLESGRLGRLKRVEYRYVSDQMKRRDGDSWRVDAESAGGGLFFDLGSHALDLIDFLVGPLQGVKGEARNKGGVFAVEDEVEMSFNVGDVKGEASWSFVKDGREEGYLFVGEKGEMRISCFGQEVFGVRFSDGGEEHWEIANPRHVQEPLIAQMVGEMRGVPGVSMVSTGESGLRTQRVMDLVTDGFYRGRGDRFWERV